MGSSLTRPHVLVDLGDCDPDRLDDEAGVRALLLDVARNLATHVVGDIFHRFSPHGVTGVVAIEESHLSVHTWVESRYAAVDLFLCNSEVDAEQIDAEVQRMATFFGARRVAVKVVRRGATHGGRKEPTA